MADTPHEKVTSKTSEEGVSNIEQPKVEDDQADADKLSKDWTDRLVYLTDPPLKESPDILVAILFLIFTDNGFTPVNNQDLEDGTFLHDNEIKHKIPSNWKTVEPEKYCINFKLPGYVDFTCNFIAKPLDELLLATCVCTYPDVVYSVSLKVSDFITYQLDALNIKQPKELLVTFKNKVVTPVKSAAYTYKGVANPCLLGLPKELLEHIYLLAGPIAVCNLMRTSQRLNILGKNQTMWQSFFIQDFDNFNSSSDDDDPQDWYLRYRDAHLAKVHMRRRSVNVKFKRNRVFFED